MDRAELDGSRQAIASKNGIEESSHGWIRGGQGHMFEATPLEQGAPRGQKGRQRVCQEHVGDAKDLNVKLSWPVGANAPL